MHGFLKGKRIQAEDMQKVCNNGFSMCAGVVLLDGLGYTIPGFPFSEADGDPDKQCRLVPGSIAPLRGRRFAVFCRPARRAGKGPGAAVQEAPEDRHGDRTRVLPA
jgi:hypothetical protein